MNERTRKNMTDDAIFEKGLTMLLKHAYKAPQASEAFRQNLLQDLKNSQRGLVRARRSRVLSVVFGGAVAAAAAVAFAFLPFGSAPEAAPGDLAAAPAAALPAPAAAKAPAQSLAGAAAIALQPLQVRDAGAAEWRSLATDEPFTLAAGMEIRTPLGAMDNTGFGVRGGPAVMLVGMSALKVTDDGGLQVVDGQTMLDLSRAPQAYTVALNRQKVALQPGAMVLLGVDNGEDYASGGAPAPTLALLHGAAEVVGGADGGALHPGRLYELYDTGTGRFPSRGLSQAESQQRFMPMIDAIRAANERYR